MQFAGTRRQLAKIGKVVDENPPGFTLCKSCNDVTINRVYPIDYPEKTSSIGQVFQARQRFRTLRALYI